MSSAVFPNDVFANTISSGTLPCPDRMERYIGLAIEAVPGPALVILHEALLRNLDKMAAFCATQHGVKLRPHAKTHKSARIAAMQIERGAVGVCVQKLSEAEALAAQGIRDIFISNEIVNPAKLARVAALAQHIRLALAVDSEPGIEMLAAAVAGHRTSLQVIVEVNVGQDRCGVAPPLAGMLARKVVQTGLAFAGIHAYHGKAQHIVDPIERAQASAATVVLAKQARLSVESEGISCPLITGAGTGTFFTDAVCEVFGEIQPGSYVFMDRDYGRNRLQADHPVFESALFVKTQVISRSPTRAVVDAGHKLIRSIRACQLFGNGSSTTVPQGTSMASCLVPKSTCRPWARRYGLSPDTATPR